MMCGTCDDAAEMILLRRKYWVQTAFDVGMLCVKSNPVLASSPDVVVVMKTDHFDYLVENGQGA